MSRSGALQNDALQRDAPQSGALVQVRCVVRLVIERNEAPQEVALPAFSSTSFAHPHNARFKEWKP